MIRFSNLSTIALYKSKYIRSVNPTLPRIIHLFHSIAEQPKKVNIILNLRKTFSCSEYTAQNIYNQFPSLRAIEAIKCDTLEYLRSKVCLQSIAENPLLVLVDIGEIQICVK